MRAVNQCIPSMSLSRALHLCGISKGTWSYPTPGTDRRTRQPAPWMVGAVRRIGTSRPTIGTRTMAHQMARELGAPVNRKRSQRICRIKGWI